MGRECVKGRGGSGNGSMADVWCAYGLCLYPPPPPPHTHAARALPPLLSHQVFEAVHALGVCLTDQLVGHLDRAHDLDLPGKDGERRVGR